VQNVTDLEMHVDENKKIFDDMDIEIKRRMDDRAHATEILPNMLCIEDKLADEPDYFDDGNFIPEVDDVNRYDEYIGTEVLFDFLGDDAARGQVIKHVKG
jgi:hypothetical protein